jgi:hypothetical protein
VIRETLFFGSLTVIATVSTLSFGDAIEPDFEPSARRSQQMESAQPDQRAKLEQSERPEGRQEWRKVLLTANQEVAIALKRSVDALRAYQSMRHRRRPRGDAKQAIMDELDLSREGLTTAQQDLAKLEKTARRAGAPPSWMKFDPAEIQAGTQVPASQQP